MEHDQAQQESVWEYQWEFEWAPTPMKPPIIERTKWFMTDYEAQRWWAYGRPDSRRLDETRRDRNVAQAKAQSGAPSTGGYKPWDHPNYSKVNPKR